MSSEPRTAPCPSATTGVHDHPLPDTETGRELTEWPVVNHWETAIAIRKVEAEARATAEAEIGRLQRQRAQWLRLHTAEIDRLREAIEHLAGMVLGGAGTEYAETVLAEYDADRREPGDTG